MHKLRGVTRREFLQQGGILAGGLAASLSVPAFVPLLPSSHLPIPQWSDYWRVVKPLQLVSQQGEMVQLWHNMLVRAEDHAFNAANTNSLQPLERVLPVDAEIGAWAQVSDAMSVVRAWGSTAAPAVTRLGHGAIAYVADELLIDGKRWLGVSTGEDQPLRGWTLASQWARLQFAPIAADVTHLNVHHLLDAQAALSVYAPPETYATNVTTNITGNITTSREAEQGATFRLAYRQMLHENTLNDGCFVLTFRHHEQTFTLGGWPGASTGAGVGSPFDVAVEPAHARMLYALLQDGTPIHIS